MLSQTFPLSVSGRQRECGALPLKESAPSGQVRVLADCNFAVHRKRATKINVVYISTINGSQTFSLSVSGRRRECGAVPLKESVPSAHIRNLADCHFAGDKRSGEISPDGQILHMDATSALCEWRVVPLCFCTG